VDSVAATVIVEALMYAIGIWIYMRVTRAKDRIGSWGFWSYVVVVALLYVADVLSPPPTSVKPFVIAAIPLTLFLVWWAWWCDRHREAR
jgi:uncharacterized membrane protein YdjX (TVP38/TMEM64 family)